VRPTLGSKLWPEAAVIFSATPVDLRWPTANLDATGTRSLTVHLIAATAVAVSIQLPVAVRARFCDVLADSAPRTDRAHFDPNEDQIDEGPLQLPSSFVACVASRVLEVSSVAPDSSLASARHFFERLGALPARVEKNAPGLRLSFRCGEGRSVLHESAAPAGPGQKSSRQ